jgi:hypothetical protein
MGSEEGRSSTGQLVNYKSSQRGWIANIKIYIILFVCKSILVAIIVIASIGVYGKYCIDENKYMIVA